MDSIAIASSLAKVDDQLWGSKETIHGTDQGCQSTVFIKGYDWQWWSRVMIDNVDQGWQSKIMIKGDNPR